MNFSVKLTDIFEIEAQPSLNEDIFISQDSQNEGYVIHSLNILGKGSYCLEILTNHVLKTCLCILV